MKTIRYETEYGVMDDEMVKWLKRYKDGKATWCFNIKEAAVMSKDSAEFFADKVGGTKVMIKTEVKAI